MKDTLLYISRLFMGVGLFLMLLIMASFMVGYLKAPDTAAGALLGFFMCAPGILLFDSDRTYPSSRANRKN